MTDTNTIVDGSVVTIHYKLTLEDGQVIDSSEGQEPMAYLHGANGLVPGLESALGGKAEGEKLEVKVTPKEGYGELDPEGVQEVPRNAFPDDADLTAGVQFQATDQDDNPIMGTIEAADDKIVKVDFNHPLAGKTLNFDVEVVSIRAATAEEQEHGHAHGAGGHNH
ncbi:MAG: FKBP-type peptidyl-prolyl cis-trans isomerase SlyD [Planctomycetota bacterium]|jgi:FKBP-type peptidyl-prolyl cis-trans isomerase SlyD